MEKISTNIRFTVRSILADSREYDASTMRITRTGEVTALKDADKTFAGNDKTRYVVGHMADMVGPDGARREGY